MTSELKLVADKTFVITRKFTVDECPPGDSKFYRKAVHALAKDLISCRGVTVSKQYDYEKDRWMVSYFIRPFRSQTILP